MAKFIVTAKDLKGGKKTIVFEAPNKNVAVADAQAQGFFIVGVEEIRDQQTASARSQSAITKKFAHNNVTLEDIVSFAKQLATMLEAGVPLLRSVSVIADQVESRDLAQVLHDVRGCIEQGQSFSKSLGKHPKVFSSFWVSLVEVGEASGTLPAVLKKLTEYMEQAAAFRSQIIGALIYPAVLFTICVGAVLFFALFIGPTFERVFHDMNVELPGVTVAMLAIFNFIKTKFFFIILFFIGVFFGLKFYLATPAGRWQFEQILFGLPGFGLIAKLIVIEKFTSQMAILVQSGVPILLALEISERLVENLTCAEVIRKVREAVKEGKLLAEPMERSAFFPPMAVQMIRVGEETGELAQMLNHVAVYYKHTVEEFMKRISTLIEPVMLVFMGGIIGAIVVAMFLPIISLSGGGGG